MNVRMKFRTGLAALLSMILLFTSCDEEKICDENTRSFLKAGLYKISEGEVQDSVAAELFILSLGDVSIYWDSANISKIQFPLNPELKQTGYLMIADSVADTLHFNYETDLIFVSYPCGFAPEYKITSVNHTSNGIDSIEIIKNKVDPSDEENIRIFL